MLSCYFCVLLIFACRNQMRGGLVECFPLEISSKGTNARIQIVTKGIRESLLYNQSHSESKNYRLEACCLSRSFLREYLYCYRGLLCCNSTENVRLLRTEGILG